MKDRILLIDDQEDYGNYIKTLLEKKSDVEVIYEWDAKHAINRITNGEKYAFVMIDIRMPSLSGFEVAKLLNKLGTKLPIIFLTGFPLEDVDHKEIIDAGAVDLITKPLESHQTELFINKIKMLINAYRIYGENKYEEEYKYRTIFDNAPVSMWEEDCMEIKKEMLKLKYEIGINNVKKYLIENKDFAVKLAKTIKIKKVNKKTLEVYEAKTEDDLKKSITDTFSEKSIDCFIELLFAIANEDRLFCKECTAKTIKGRLLKVMLQTNLPEKMEDFKHVIISIVDITEIKKHENEIKEIYNTLCKSSSVIFRRDLKSGWPLDFVTNNIYELTEYLSSEFISKKILGISILHPEDAAKIENEIAKHIESKDNSFECVYRIVTKSGKIKWVREVSTPVLDDDGNMVYLQGIIRDITNEKNSKDKILKNLQTFKNLIETTKASYLILDMDGKIEEANNNFLDIIQCTNKDIIGVNLLDLVNPDESNKVKKGIEMVENGFGIEDLELCLSGTICNKKGNWVRINANIMENGKRNILCLIRDITSKKLEEFKHYINNQKQKDKVKQSIDKIKIKIKDMNTENVKTDSSLESESEGDSI